MRLTNSALAVSSVALVATAAPTGSNSQGLPQVQGGDFLSGIFSLLSNPQGHTNAASYGPNSGGTGGIFADLQVPADHIKFTMNPASAADPIPAAQNSMLREGHRMGHFGIYDSMTGGRASQIMAQRKQQGQQGQDPQGQRPQGQQGGQQDDAQFGGDKGQ